MPGHHERGKSSDRASTERLSVSDAVMRLVLGIAAVPIRMRDRVALRIIDVAGRIFAFVPWSVGILLHVVAHRADQGWRSVAIV
jgi:hypothetical protein